MQTDVFWSLNFSTNVVYSNETVSIETVDKSNMWLRLNSSLQKRFRQS